MLIQTTAARLSAALEGMQQQAKAAFAMLPIPEHDLKSRKQAKSSLRAAQEVMQKHDLECRLICKAARIMAKSIPDIGLSELVETHVCGLVEVQA